MNTPLEQLEHAILNRARILADSQLRTAQQQQEKILTDSAKRLHLREEREVEMAKAMADQEYRRQIQASEIKMHAEVDQLRWTLIQSVMGQLKEHLKKLTDQHPTYENLLKQYLIQASQLFQENELVIEVNAQDHSLLSSQWSELLKDLPRKQFNLIVSAQHFTGGLLVRNQQDRQRIDNTFEGLIARMENELYQVITAQLFASTVPVRNI